MVNDSIVRVLGIETSCDETAAAVVVEEGNLTTRVWKIDSSVVASQVDIHREWGGVVPELASLISEKLLSFGTEIQTNPFTMPLYGNADGHRPFAKN